MGKQTYYRVGNLDLRLTNADQNLTEDVLQFCSGTAHLYSQLSKPLLDVVLICWTLVRQNQSRGSGFLPSVSPLVLASGVIGVTGVLLRLCSPAFGQLAAEQVDSLTVPLLPGFLTSPPFLCPPFLSGALFAV